MPGYLSPIVLETTTTTGTGTYQLAGAQAGHRTFLDAFGNGSLCYYSVFDEAGAFEVGLGTINSSNQLARTRVLVSTNSGNAVNWGAGTKEVANAIPPAAGLSDGIGTLPSADATPSVKGQNVWKATGSTVTITNFDDGTEGQILTISAENSNTTIQAGGNFRLKSGNNFNLTSNDSIMLVMRNSIWYELSRSVNT